ncbi:MAG: hypothetical protein CVU00_01435 [Bacteroidetes bacterium HGW-Bacteroidetes-17]|jgi:hypothetical protein|nr:MAG: hypothetical protein CVU00_01435 [Bacteroidetes bacterium HGW-Bacteroidetes-17]
MAKKLTLKLDFSSEYTLIVISCHLKDYRLTFFLNNKLHLHLSRIDDFIQEGHDKTDLNYSVYFYQCLETQSNFCLISNHHSDGKLIPTIGTIDYFLLIENEIPNGRKKELIKEIKTIPNVLTAYELDLAKVKNIHHLLAELELQFIENKNIKKTP